MEISSYDELWFSHWVLDRPALHYRECDFGGNTCSVFTIAHCSLLIEYNLLKFKRRIVFSLSDPNTNIPRWALLLVNPRRMLLLHGQVLLVKLLIKSWKIKVLIVLKNSRVWITSNSNPCARLSGSQNELQELVILCCPWELRQT